MYSHTNDFSIHAGARTGLAESSLGMLGIKSMCLLTTTHQACMDLIQPAQSEPV